MLNYQFKNFLKFIKILYNLPTPSNISYVWNFGSLLGVCLIFQLITGGFLSIQYSNNIFRAFDRVSSIIRDVNYGWLFRLIHANIASLFFVIIYCHIGRGLYYNSYFFKFTWISGSILLLLLIITAFLGYVLPWGQMSFWGATVITNLVSAIPYWGRIVVEWIWGGFSISNATLIRFFSLHFIVPFIILFIVLVHLIFLHKRGSSNSLVKFLRGDKLVFYPYFLIKDYLRIIIVCIFILILIIVYPYILSDRDNFIIANSFITPIHIQPEWYFLFAYAILRAIPNKLGGVIALFLSIFILFIIPFITGINKLNLDNNFF